MAVRHSLLLQAFLPAFAIAQSFNMWPIVDTQSLASVLNVSQTCVGALNATVDCDPSLFRMAGQVDLYYWSSDNITDLCTSDCIESTSSWMQGVYDTCSPTDLISMDSKLVPIDTVAIRYTDGLGLACLTDQQIPIVYTNTTNATDTTSGISAAPTSTTTPTSSGTTTASVDTMPDSNVTYEYNYAPAANFCFNQSQSWVGIDIPDCDADPDNELCSDPVEGMRIANYYNDTILCSPCFLSVMWWRVNSPFLPDSDYSDYLIDQFQDIQDVCNMTMADTLVRGLPSYAGAPSPNFTDPGTTSPGAPNSDLSCISGQNLTTSGTSCDAISQQYGVTTGDLQSATGTDDCSFSGVVCVPKACSLAQIGANETCDSYAASLSSDTLNVTDALFLAWNPNIQGLCDSLTEGQYVCTGPPGGTYKLPPPILGNDTNAGGQQRGGQGSGSNPNGPLGSEGPTTNSTASAPTQANITSDCTLFAYAAQNDTCYDFSQSFSITLEQFTLWNPVLGYPDGHNCRTQFWAGYDYCVQVNGTSSSSSSSSSSSASSTTSLPYPTQTGIDPACNKYAEAVSGDYCYQFAQEHNITTDELYAWNKVLGAGGANCSTAFQAGYDYCIGVSTTSTSTTTSATTSTSPTSATSTPLPTQSGITPDCDKLVKAESGDYCYEFAQVNNITTTELYDWNTILGPNGEDCSTKFQAGYGYCVAVSD